MSSSPNLLHKDDDDEDPSADVDEEEQCGFPSNSLVIELWSCHCSSIILHL